MVLLLVGVPGRGGLGDGVPLVGPSPAGAAVPGLPFTETGCQGDSDSVARLYTAAFGRAPEAGGFDFWMDNYTGGSWGLPRMATFFAGSPEFVSTYGDLDELGFVRQLYRNVLGREGEAGGVAFWHGELQRGMTRGTLLLRFSESPENIRRSGTTEPTLGHFNTGRTGPWVCPPASPPADPPASPPVEPPLGPTAPTASLATVTSITDGDTLRVSPGGPVRIIGIDAPESGSCIAALATARLGELAPVGRTVTLLDDPARTDDRDRFDRLLRFVEVDGVDVGRQLILEGLATAFAFDGGSSRADDYAAAEATARNRGVGIWDATACTAPPAPQPVVPPTPTPEPDPTPPAADCHPAYSSPCLPIVDDLNCGDIRQVVILVDPRIDPYQLDGRGGTVDDGIGCESYG